MRLLVLAILFLTLQGCDRYDRKWETLGRIRPEVGTLSNAIYFKDSLNGVIGGYQMIENESSDSIFFNAVPIVHRTEDGGRTWQKLPVPKLKNGVLNLKFTDSTILCQIDTTILVSKDYGSSWKIRTTGKRKKLKEFFYDAEKYRIEHNEFNYKGTKYIVLEKYQSRDIAILVCRPPRSWTNYYFISKDSGDTFAYLQREANSRKRKFILDEKYLYAYDPYYGLQRMKF